MDKCVYGEPGEIAPRQELLTLFEAAFDAVNGRQVVIEELKRNPLNFKKIILLATGKAAPAMALGAYELLGERICGGLVVSKDEHCLSFSQETGLPCLEARHPVPDSRSLEAGAAVVELLAHMPVDAALLVLTSGGTSALLEVLPEGLGLDDLKRLNQWLLSSGLDIHAVNRIRQSVSCIKGGRLLGHVHGNPIVHLVMSDVPGDDLAAIGSGMWVQPTAAAESAAVPAWVRQMQQAAAAKAGKSSEDDAEIEHRLIATNQKACQAAAQRGEEHGHIVFLYSRPLEGEAAQMGEELARFLLTAPPGLHIWGGETTVKLPPNPGQGGRNQHLALAAASVLAGHDGIYLLAAGTDGTDGPTEAAGALVDGGSIERGMLAGLNAEHCLQTADAGRFLEASGDLLDTGPTGCNVMDMVIAYKTMHPDGQEDRSWRR